MTTSSTTIRVSRETLELLDELRQRFNARSYDEVILKLILEYKRSIIKRYFGVDQGKITSYREEVDRGKDRNY